MVWPLAIQLFLAATIYGAIQESFLGISVKSVFVTVLSTFSSQAINRIAMASALVIESLGLNTNFHFIVCHFAIHNSLAFVRYGAIHAHSVGISV
jgi:hypothetical protein